MALFVDYVYHLKLYQAEKCPPTKAQLLFYYYFGTINIISLLALPSYCVLPMSIHLKYYVSHHKQFKIQKKRNLILFCYKICSISIKFSITNNPEKDNSIKVVSWTWVWYTDGCHKTWDILSATSFKINIDFTIEKLLEKVEKK